VTTTSSVLEKGFGRGYLQQVSKERHRRRA
jgi:hypothetical protein